MIKLDKVYLKGFLKLNLSKIMIYKYFCEKKIFSNKLLNF